LKHFLQSLALSLKTQNHYSALSLALTIPDICGWVLDPNMGSKSRCIAWLIKYVQHKYTLPANNLRPETVFLNGSDFYALRCAYLNSLFRQKGWMIHNNKHNSTIQLQVDLFCNDIASSANRLLSDIVNDGNLTSRLNQLMLIYDVNGKPL
jgi:hypothetical protein